MIGALNRLGVEVRRGLSQFAVGSKEPSLGFDFIDNTYLADGTKNLSQALTHSRSGNATMTDSDGNIKWAPHNLLTYSEDLTGADWTETGTASVDDFETISFAADDGSRLQSTGVSASAGPEYTVEFDYISDGTFEVLARAASVTQASNTASASVTQTTHTLTVPAGSSGVDSLWFRRNAGFTATEVTIRNVRIYRSDLGGMVDNPERGDSYVPTAARPFGPELFSDFELEGEWIDNNDGSYTVTSATTSTDLRNNSFVVTGKTYEYKFTISGDTQIVYLGSTSPEFLSAGTYTKVVTANTHWLIFRATTGQTATVSNISIKETVNPAVARYLPRVGHHVYNGDAWVNEGLLHESEARTNLFEYSSEFDNAWWVKSNSTITSNAATAPDGTLTADKLIANTNNSSHFIEPSISVSGSYIISFYAKAAGYQYATIGGSGIFSANNAPVFDLINGTATKAPSGSTVTDVFISDEGNGWYRCSCYVSSVTNWLGIGVLDSATAYDALFAGDGTSGIYIYGAQFEQASTPSSYIPTAGATVTRAAETLTVPAANLPWPYPEVIGDELVANGTFDTDTSGWTANADAVVTWSSGEIVVQRVTGSIDTAIQEITTEVGKVYYISADTTDLTATGSLKIATAAGGGLNASTFESATGVNTTLSVIFIAQTTTTYIALGGNAGGTISSYDNVSVREINPLSVSIQMDGRMTYADEGSPVDKTLFYWYESNNANIRLYLDTSSTKTGGAYWIQDDGGARVDFYSAGNVYSPGLNVPYNIASRHGSNFTNGAVDGVALIADTSATGFPALSATDLELGYDYMGTIGTFRVWDQDLGDDGIVTAAAPSLEPSLSLTFDGSGLSFTVLDWSE